MIFGVKKTVQNPSLKIEMKRERLKLEENNAIVGPQTKNPPPFSTRIP